jgi:hypothetical protein
MHVLGLSLLSISALSSFVFLLLQHTLSRMNLGYKVGSYHSLALAKV